MEIQRTLEEVGFTKTEAKIYLELLNSGKSKAGEIIKKTGIYKSNVYQALNSLIKKGFIGEIIINNVKHFESYDVGKLFDLLEERKIEIDSQKQKLKKIIDQSTQKQSSKKQERILFYSEEGIKTILYDTLKSLKRGDIIYSFGSRGDIMLEYFRYYFPNYMKQRVKKEIRFRGIFAEDDRDEFKEKILPLTEAKFLNAENFPPMQTIIYKNKVAIFIVNEKMNAVLIENENLAKGYVKYFDFIWDSIKMKPLTKRK